MKKGIIGRKVGMTQIFDEKGNVIPVTVIEAGPCTVAQVKTVETDGYDAVQLGFGEVKDKHINKPEKGHFTKAQQKRRRIGYIQAFSGPMISKRDSSEKVYNIHHAIHHDL